MKKILGQFYGYGVVNPTPTGGPGGTLQDYTIIYEVPVPITPDVYSDKIYTECAIYVYPCIKSGEKDIEMSYNIRIIKAGDAVDPRMTTVGGLATNADEAQEFRYKGIIVDKPSSDKKDYPKIYDRIMLQTGDKIVVQVLTPGITIQVFGEELQYDTDALFKMQRDRLDVLTAMIETQEGLNRTNITAAAGTIATAIGNIAACTP